MFLYAESFKHGEYRYKSGNIKVQGSLQYNIFQSNLLEVFKEVHFE